MIGASTMRPKALPIVEDATPFGAIATPMPRAASAWPRSARARRCARALSGRRLQAQQAKPNSREASAPRMMKVRPRSPAASRARPDRTGSAHTSAAAASRPRSAKIAHGQHGKPTPAKPKAGDAENGSEAHARGEIGTAAAAAPQRQIGDHQQARRGPRQHGVARNWNWKRLDDRGTDDHHEQEERRDRARVSRRARRAGCRRRLAAMPQAALRNSEPTAYPAAMASDDVQHRRQNGAQQELRVVERGIGEHVSLNNQRARRVGCRSGGHRRRERLRSRSDRVRDRGCGAVAGGEILSVVERRRSADISRRASRVRDSRACRRPQWRRPSAWRAWRWSCHRTLATPTPGAEATACT